MQKIIAIVWKDIALRFASRSEWLFFLILPLVFTVLLAGGTPSGDGDNRLTLVVVDQSGTPLAADILANLEKSTSVRPEVQPLADAEAAFEDRRLSAFLVLPAGFSVESLEAGSVSLELRQQPNDLDALVAERAVQVAAQRTGSAVQVALNSVQQAEQMREFPSAQAREAYFAASLDLAQRRLEEAPDRLEVTQARVADEDPVDYDPATSSSAGQLITWVFIPLLGISQLFALEREEGTLRRLLVSPTRRAVYLLGTILGQVLTAGVQVSLLIAFGILVMKLNWGADLAGLAVLLGAFILAAAAFGTALGTAVKTSSQANGLSIMLGMVLAMMGGCWYPIELFPEFVRSAVRVFPTTWAMQGMLDLGLRGGGLAEIISETVVLLGFAGVFFVFGIWRFKYE
jgi:ABC-2 type transport system permease protein